MHGFRRLLLIGFAVFALTLVGLCLLPNDPYIRWQSTRTEAFARLGWIYERVHDDPTPIDVAFIGTSHTMNGVDGSAVARVINGGRPAGQCVTVTNLSMPAYGRNMQWLVARELLTHRKVKTLVIEVFENETRKAHPVFANVADAKDIVGAPLVINLNYFHDLVRLPFRQASLTVESAAPEQFGLKRRFSFADYDGSDVDNTRVVNVGGVAVTPPRNTSAPLDVLYRRAKEERASKNLHMLGARFESLEYRYPRLYLQRMLDLAKANGATVRLLYLPGYAKPERPVADPTYAGLPMIFVNDILVPQDRWYDVDHLNADGAALLSQRLGAELAPSPELAGGGRTDGASACQNGVAPRSVIRPFEKP